MDQSRKVFLQMQEQLQNQTRNVFSGFTFPGFPGFGAPSAGQEPEDSPKAGDAKKPGDEK